MDALFRFNPFLFFKKSSEKPMRIFINPSVANVNDNQICHMAVSKKTSRLSKMNQLAKSSFKIAESKIPCTTFFLMPVFFSVRLRIFEDGPGGRCFGGERVCSLPNGKFCYDSHFVECGFLMVIRGGGIGSFEAV